MPWEATIRRFEAAWHQGRRPEIDDYLPPDGPARSAVLRELVHIDLERRLNAGDAFRVEAYLNKYPTLAADGTAVVDLLGAEYALRLPYEPQLTRQEYVERFPEHGYDLSARLAAFAASSRAQRSEKALASGGVGEPFARPDDRLTPPGYEMLEVLGKGGMGIVYLARQVALNRLVALKMIRAGRDADREERERFRLEAEAAATLQHPHIVQIYEVGEYAGQPYCVLEFVDGGSLERRGTDPASLGDFAAIHFRIAQIHYTLEANDEALAALDHGLDLLDQLALMGSDLSEFHRQLAGWSPDMRRVHRGSHPPTDLASAQRILQRAAVTWEAFVQANPDNASYRRTLAAFYAKIGELHDSTKFAGDALVFLEKAREIAQKLADEHPGVAVYRADLADSLSMIGLVQVRRSSLEAEEPLRRALELHRQLATEFPDVPYYRQRLGAC